jgi:hypothetical protein
MKAHVVTAMLFAHRISAIHLPKIPIETDAAKHGLNPQGWTPKPTNVPHIDLMRRNPLDRRQLTLGELIGYFAADNTCGYVEGSLGMSA